MGEALLHRGQVAALRLLVHAGELRPGRRNTDSEASRATLQALERAGFARQTLTRGGWVFVPTDAAREWVRAFDARHR